MEVMATEVNARSRIKAHKIIGTLQAEFRRTITPRNRANEPPRPSSLASGTKNEHRRSSQVDLISSVPYFVK